MSAADPASNCQLCPRLADWRLILDKQQPDWHNAPVPCFGNPKTAQLLIVGLAPGLRGANRTGRVFTGDGAGIYLYETLLAHGFAKGHYEARANDRLKLIDCVITNAVRCVPPENKPTTEEIKQCRPFLAARIAGMKKLRAIIALGHIAHGSVVETLGARKSAYPFQHGAAHRFETLTLFDSYHCSQRNFSTKILTPQTFGKVFKKIRAFLD